MTAQLMLPYIPAPTLAQLARRAQERLGQAFARAFRPRCGAEAESRAVQVELLDPARVATEFARDHANEIANFECRFAQPRGGLVGAVWTEVAERWAACMPLRIYTILRHALALVTTSLVRRTHRGRAVVASLTGEDGTQQDVADVRSNPLDIRVIAQAMASRVIHDVQRERGVGIDQAVRIAVERIGREVKGEEMRALVQTQARCIERIAASVGTW